MRPSTRGGRERGKEEGEDNEKEAVRGTTGTPEIDRSPKYETITTIPKGVSRTVGIIIIQIYTS